MKKVMSFVLCLAISSVIVACYNKKQAADSNTTLNSEKSAVKKEVVVKEKAPKKIAKKKVVKVKAE